MKLDQRSIVYNALRDTAGFWFIIVVSSLSWMRSGVPPLATAAVVIGITLLLLAVAAGWEYLVWKNFRYRFTAGTVQINHGVFRHNHRDIPYQRIQNVGIKKNLVQRVLGIARIDIETAGGSKETEGSLTYVAGTRAPAIRQRIRALQNQAEAPADAAPRHESIHEIDGRKLLLLGLTSLDHRAVASVVAVLGIGGGLTGPALESLGLSALAIAVTLAVAAIAGAAVANFALVLIKYTGYRLWQTHDALEYEHGLFNRSEGSIPLDKVQSLRIEANPLKRWLGMATLNVETAGFSARKSAAQGSEAAVPIAPRDTAMRLAQHLERFDIPALDRPPKRARRRYIGRYILLTLVPTAALVARAYATAGSLFIPVAVFAVLLPAAMVIGHLQWANRGFARGDRHFFTRNGFWTQTIAITPYFRMQNLLESQTVFQKQYELGSLNLDTAGTPRPPFLAPVSAAVDFDAGMIQQLRKQVYRQGLREFS